jgi:hypothetical protein
MCAVFRYKGGSEVGEILKFQAGHCRADEFGIVGNIEQP